MKRIFWNAYSQRSSELKRGEKEKTPTIDEVMFMLRDGQAFIYMMDMFLDHDYSFGDVVLNFPPKTFGGKTASAIIPENAFQKGDLLIQATRPPLDDPTPKQITEQKLNYLRPIERSSTNLEHQVFTSLRSIFSKLDRYEVNLQPKWGDELPAWVTVDANKRGAAPNIGFVVFLPDLPTFGCQFLAVFALDGMRTFAWACTLYAHLSKHIRRMVNSNRESLMVAEFEVRRFNGNLQHLPGFLSEGLNPVSIPRGRLVWGIDDTHQHWESEPVVVREIA